MRIFSKHKPKSNKERRPRTLLEKMDETKFNPYERKNGEAMTEIEKMDQGCLIERPGWIRMSIHPTTTTEEIVFVCEKSKGIKSLNLTISLNSMTESTIMSSLKKANKHAIR